MMMSVLTFCRIRGAALASRTVKASTVVPPVSDRAHVGDAAGDGGGRGHGGAGEMRASARPLATDEVAVGGRDAPLAGCDGVAVDRQAHRAARLAPFETGVEEDAVEALGLGLALDVFGARHDPGPH